MTKDEFRLFPRDYVCEGTGFDPEFHATVCKKTLHAKSWKGISNAGWSIRDFGRKAACPDHDYYRGYKVAASTGIPTKIEEAAPTYPAPLWPTDLPWSEENDKG